MARAFVNMRVCLVGVAQGPVRPAQSILEVGDDKRIADRVSFEIGGRPVEPVAEDRAQRPAFRLFGAKGSRFSEDRRQDFASLFRFE